MRICYLPKDKLGDRIIISDPMQIRHLAVVLRLKRGDEVSAFDGCGYWKPHHGLVANSCGNRKPHYGLVANGKEKEYLCRIEEINKGQVTLLILHSKTASSNNPAIALACAIPKNVKMDYIIQKTTELGVSRIIPMWTKRTIVKIDPQRAADKQKRWQRIAQEASKQCKRIKFPLIDPVREFKDVLSEISRYDLAIIPNLEKGNKAIANAVNAFKGKSILFFIGPEGDFTPDEIAAGAEKGCVGVSLGDLVLKVDTAAIAVTAFLRFITL